jgi:hypothetical protein
MQADASARFTQAPRKAAPPKASRGQSSFVPANDPMHFAGDVVSNEDRVHVPRVKRPRDKARS